MNHTRRLHPVRRITSALVILTGLTAALLASSAAAPAAFARPAPPLGGTRPAQPPQVHTIVVGGTPGWQIVLITVVAALLAAVAAVILDRTRATRRHQTATSA
jgi:hypothetical protein